MSTLFTLIALVFAIAGLAAAIGHVGYLTMLNSAANKRAGGAPVAQYVRSRWPIAGGTTAVAVVALLFTAGGIVPNILAIILSIGAGTTAVKALQSTQARYRSGG